jgi:hydroxypyruvate isomerase
MKTIDRRDLCTSAMALLATSGLARAQSKSASPAPAPIGDRPGRTPHTRFAVNVEMWWRDLPFLDRLREAAGLGFPAIEFWNWQRRDIDAMAKLCRELGLDVAQFTAWGFEPGLNDPANHAAFVQAIGEGCTTAKKLGAKAMCVVGGNDRAGVTQKEMHAHIIDGLKLAAKVAESNDVTLILEPMNIRVDHPGHCLHGSDHAIAICAAVNSTHVKINWDLYHLQITEGDLCGHLREGFAHIGYVQVADSPGRNEPGTGEVNYTRVLQELARLGYRGYVGLECSPKASELEAALAVHRADTW